MAPLRWLLADAMLLNKFVPKEKDPIKQREWILGSSINSDVQRPLTIHQHGYEFNARRVVADWVGDEDCFYIWSVLLLVRGSSVFCRVRYNVANRKVGALPT